MNKLLSRANIRIRTTRPLDIPSMLITTFRRKNFMQLTFHTCGCRYSAAGTCTMCNYGKSVTNDSLIILDELEKICHSKDFLECDMLLLGATGSFLDEKEISKELQYAIMKRVAKTHMKEIHIETHYKSVTDEKLYNIHKLFPQRIYIELGLESTTQDFQDNILNKNISLFELKSVIDKIHTCNIKVSLNILLGLPFLTPKEQLADARKSIDWALHNRVENIVVFPVNIQPYTVFEWWYDHGYMELPSLWLLFELIFYLPDDVLPHICLSWYGNRSISYSAQRKTITPCACANCHPQLLSFFEDFASNSNLKYRKRRMYELDQTLFLCNCRQKLVSEVENPPEIFRRDEAHIALERWLDEYVIN